MNDYDSNSDEAPEEFSFQASIEESNKFKESQTKEISQVKKHIKQTRKLHHEKNKIQREEQRKRLEELESKKFPEDLLDLVRDNIKNNQSKGDKRKSLSARKNKKKKFKEDYCFSTSVNDSVVVQVRPLEVPDFKDQLQLKAENFLNSKLYKNKDVKRMPSRDLRMMKEKRKHSGKVLRVAVSK